MVDMPGDEFVCSAGYIDGKRSSNFSKGTTYSKRNVLDAFNVEISSKMFSLEKKIGVLLSWLICYVLGVVVLVEHDVPLIISFYSLRHARYNLLRHISFSNHLNFNFLNLFAILSIA
jgi:hypothetical protein